MSNYIVNFQVFAAKNLLKGNTALIAFTMHVAFFPDVGLIVDAGIFNLYATLELIFLPSPLELF